MRWPASRLSRAAASAASAIRLVSKRNCAAVETLLTFCPPGPEARTKLISMSFSSIVRSREIRSMMAPDRDDPRGESDWWRIAVAALKDEGTRAPDAAQRAALALGSALRAARAQAPWCAADPGVHTAFIGFLVGPGSAVPRKGRCTASGTRDAR